MNAMQACRLVVCTALSITFGLLFAGAQTAQAQFTGPDGNGNIYYNSGNVGIGSTTPQTKLQLSRDTLFTDYYGQLMLSPASNEAKRLVLGYDGTNDFAWIQAYQNSVGVKVLSLQPHGGKVGIGKTNPAEALDVAGNINLTGTINAKYQDVAEWVPSSEQLEAGTVVVLDSTKSNQVISSTASYDTRVAGVVSAQPGIALGEKGAGKVLVATTGRVKIKVDATKSPIRIGDLLVTSDVPGVAMKSEAVNLGGVQLHRPGTLVGKALEPLANGKGEILVLLSLQ